jgi:hypothetical protein
MGKLDDRYRDIIEYPYPDPSDLRLSWMNQKGFLAYLRSLSEEELIDFAKLYPAWRDQRLRKCAVIKFTGVNALGEEKVEYRVYVPKLRALRKTYYSWIKGLKLPRGFYRLITLTLYREIDLVEAWKNINHWISACLHRVRTKLRRKYKVDMYYLWVIESHKDGYPHVHIIFCLGRYVRGLKFEELLRIFQESWVDDMGNRLCADQGVDIKYIGRDVNKVRDYVLKYLVKDHDKVWGFEVKGGLVRVRLSTLLAWAFRVRFFGMSQKLKRAERGKNYNYEFLGKTSVYRLWRFVFKYDFEGFRDRFLFRCWEKVDERFVPLLCNPLSLGVEMLN